MKFKKEIIIGAALLGSLAMGNTGVNLASNTLVIQDKIKSLVKDIIVDSNIGKLAKIYNPLNPNGIETDDGYIYIVKMDKESGNLNS